MVLRVCSSIQLLECGFSRHLLGQLFAVSLTGAYRLAVQLHGDKKALVVVGSLLAGKAVFQHLPALPLDQLL